MLEGKTLTEIGTPLRLQGVSKRFGSVNALVGVSMECRAGEIHAVVGENGSGKSTLLGIASGVVSADEGYAEVGGKQFHRAFSHEARGLGIATVFQSRSLASELSVADNVFASVSAAMPAGRYLDRERWVEDQLTTFGLSVDVSQPVATLTLGQQQMLEIIKAVVTRPKLLLLDEPTTALGTVEIEALHALISEMVGGGSSVIYVSHRLPEILAVAHRVTVMRDGVSQGTYDVSDVSEDQLIALMVGESVSGHARSQSDAATVSVERKPMLRVNSLTSHGLGPIDLTIHEGEIVGVAGADGNGQQELLEAIAGMRRSRGNVTFNDTGTVDCRRPRGPLEAGIMLLSGDRLASLVPVLGVRVNATVSALKDFHVAGVMRTRRERGIVSTLTAKLRVRTPSLDQPVRLLSGGNQQKVLMARPLLRHGVRVLLVEEPTQGVDVRSRADIHTVLRRMAEEGGGIAVMSSDPFELVEMCDRVIVMSRGRIVKELSGSELGAHAIISAIVGSGSTHSPVVSSARVTEPARRMESGAKKAETSFEPRSEAASEVQLSRRRRFGSDVFAQLMPFALLALLTLGLSAYTARLSPDFLSSLNLSNLFLTALPLALIAMAQAIVLIVGGFDISVGFTATFAVVVSSFVLSGGNALGLLGGTILVLLLGMAIGAFNGTLVTFLSLPPIVATIATLSLLEGLSLLLRPVPGGTINTNFVNVVNTQVSFMPVAFLGVIVAAIVGDVILHRTRHGLGVRFVGLNPNAALRIGVRTRRIQFGSYIVAAILSTVAGILLATQVGVGDPTVGSNYALISVAAAVLGGASLFGGRGSLVGAVWGALFLSLIVNVSAPLGWSASVGDISTGLLTLVAILLYSWGAIAVRRPEIRRFLARIIRSAPDPEGSAAE